LQIHGHNCGFSDLIKHTAAWIGILKQAVNSLQNNPSRLVSCQSRRNLKLTVKSEIFKNVRQRSFWLAVPQKILTGYFFFF